MQLNDAFEEQIIIKYKLLKKLKPENFDIVAADDEDKRAH